ncbi:MAG: hypothetical protein LBF63_05205, partial [Treponema sp.]|nr:hypothetical protein [Treponema sp.]
RRLVSGKKEDFAAELMGLNAVLSSAAEGQGDMFAGGLERKEDIVRRYLGVRAQVEEIRKRNSSTLKDPAAGRGEKALAALEDAGIARAEAEGTLYQVAYHGTPHQFDRFSTGAIGTGEGSQTYGWGLYFSGKKEIAEYYAKTLGRFRPEYDGKIPDKALSKDIFVLLEFAARNSISLQESYERQLRHWETEYKVYGYDYQKETLDRLKSIDIKKIKEGGYLYEASIPEDGELLDWDKPLSGQPEHIKKSIETLFKENPILEYVFENRDSVSGKQFYRGLAGQFGTDRAASGSLYDAGIKGIRYLAGESRAAGEGTHNYIIFTGEDVQITGTLFQTEADLLEEAAGYGSWKEFRDAYEGKSRAVLEGKPVASVSSKDIPVIDGKPIDTAKKWIEEHPIGTVETVIGNVEVDPHGIHNSMSHTHYANKVFVLSAIKPILEDGAFLSELDDFNPDTGIKNYYFAAPVNLDNERKIVFIRVRETPGNNKRFYVHEVFTEDEVRAAAPLQDELDKRTRDTLLQPGASGNISEQNNVQPSASDKKPQGRPNAVSALGFVSGGNPPDLYRSIINNVLTVNPDARATDAWYESFYKDARKAYPRTLFQEGEEKAPSRAEELDRRWEDLETTREKMVKILKAVHGIFNSRETEPAEGEDRGEYDNTQRLKGRLERELPRAGTWKGYAASVATGGPLKEAWYQRLKGLIRKAPRDYRALFADLMDQGEYLEDLADTGDGELAARLADPRGEREDVKETLKKIVRDLGDEEIGALVASGDVKMYDVLEETFAAGEERGLKESEAALKAMDAEISENWARFTNQEHRDLLEKYEAMLALREAYQNTREGISRSLRDGLAITGRYKNKARLEKADYDRAMDAYLDAKKAATLEARVRVSLARREARAKERARQPAMRRTMRALRALKEMKKRIIKRITRNAAYERVGHDQAVIVKAVQRLIMPSVRGDVQQWIGPAEGTRVREIWALWREDNGQFSDELIKAAGHRAEDMA